jgi:hypothetical protein
MKTWSKWRSNLQAMEVLHLQDCIIHTHQVLRKLIVYTVLNSANFLHYVKFNL